MNVPSDTAPVYDDAYREKLIAEIASLGVWRQRLRFACGVETPGEWDPVMQFAAIKHELPALRGKRVIDLGANAGGIGIEVAKEGAIVTLAEPMQHWRQQAEFYVSHEKPANVSVIDATVHTARYYGPFDVVFCLGLIYHFRHPQLILDELSQWVGETLVISTQVVKGDLHIMKNRRDQLPMRKNDLPLRGWQFTVPLFRDMLYNSGFKDVRVARSGSAGAGFTNAAYFVCSAGTPVDIDLEHRRFI